ncbi:MAG TPA: gamma-glutamyl-gamma-aminobutyrate hydrolase family protein [Chthonomonadaceae bacterium]|nr:gamma-glutamyl-gamma-aminobutyrate hydrolase family protein [Chthonomonadaceae bacterium]
MARKVVGITCSTAAADSEAGARQVLNRAYVRAVEMAGGVPVILPVTTERDVIARYLSVIDGLLLSGGVDLAPALYGQVPHPRLGTVDADRDTTEMPLIRMAVEQDVPLFAICRGIQSLNVALGGTLFQDLPSERPSEIVHQQRDLKMARDAFSHTIRTEPGSRLRGIVGAEEMPTNSFHHQALRDVADGLRVTACAPDGVIEAVERPASRYLLAVQFHPEETAPHDERSRRLFESFVAALT